MKTKKASNFFFFLLRCVFIPYLFFRYGLRIDRTISRKIKGPCIIVSNHVTFHDPFIVGISFRFGINFLASDSIFRNGFKSSIMKILVRPIPIVKGSSDPSAIREIISVIKQGGSVAIFPEGNRTFFGQTSNIKPTIGKLAKKLNVPLVMFQIRGGYHTSPRWMEGVSKGKMSASVVKVVSTDELSMLKDEEINNIISEQLYFNDYEYNMIKKIKFKGKRRAEHLETVLFACPICHSLTDLESNKSDFYCNKCLAKVKIDEYGFLNSSNSVNKMPSTILEWSNIQLDIVKRIDFSQHSKIPLFSDSFVKLFSFLRAGMQKLECEGAISLFDNRIIIGDKVIFINDISDTALHGVYKLQIYLTNGDKYMIQSTNKTNLMKHMICIYQIKYNLSDTKGDFYGY